MKKSLWSKNYQTFIESLVDSRHKTGLNQIDIAKKLKKPQPFVSKYERGERRLDVIEFFYIAKALEIDPIEFLEELYSSL